RRLARQAPAVEELVGGVRGGDRRGDGALVAEHEGGGAVTTVTLVGAAGKAGPDVRHRDQLRTGDERGRGEGGERGPHGAVHVDGVRVRVEPERGVDRRRVRL